MPIGQRPLNPFDDAFDKLQATTPLEGSIVGGQIQPISQTEAKAAAKSDMGGGDNQESPIGRVHPGFFTSSENNIKNPVLRGLAKAGDIAGSILVPGATSMIPGTRLNEQSLENREAGLESERAKTAAQKAATEHTQAETSAIPSQIEKTKAETSALENKPDQLETLQQGLAQAINDSLTNNRDPNTDPVVKVWRDAITGTQKPAAEKSTKEQLQQKLVEAQNSGNTKEAARLQKQLKDIDPLGENRIAVTVAGQSEHKSEYEQNRSDKQKAALNKVLAPNQAIVDEAAMGHELQKAADNGNSAADVDLALSFFKTMRSATSGSSGIKFTKQENDLIMGARSLWESMAVQGNKVLSHGEPLSREQRQRMVDVMDIHAKGAQRKIDEANKAAESNSTKKGDEDGDIIVTTEQLKGGK